MIMDFINNLLMILILTYLLLKKKKIKKWDKKKPTLIVLATILRGGPDQNILTVLFLMLASRPISFRGILLISCTNLNYFLIK